MLSIPKWKLYIAMAGMTLGGICIGAGATGLAQDLKRTPDWMRAVQLATPNGPQSGSWQTDSTYVRALCYYVDKTGKTVPLTQERAQ